MMHDPMINDAEANGAAAPRHTLRSGQHRGHTAWLRFLVLALCALPCLTSCSVTTKRHPETLLIQANNERDLYSTLVSAIRKYEFKLRASGVDESARTIESGWFVSLSRFKADGYRKRVLASYQPVSIADARKVPEEQLPEGGLNPEMESFLVTVRVQKEANDSMRGEDIRYAKWRPDDDDPDGAKRIVYWLASKLGNRELELNNEPGASLRDRLGLDPPQ